MFTPSDIVACYCTSPAHKRLRGAAAVNVWREKEHPYTVTMADCHMGGVEQMELFGVAI
jgi:hypothetical protein